MRYNKGFTRKKNRDFLGWLSGSNSKIYLIIILLLTVTLICVFKTLISMKQSGDYEGAGNSGSGIFSSGSNSSGGDDINSEADGDVSSSDNNSTYNNGNGSNTNNSNNNSNADNSNANNSNSNTNNSNTNGDSNSNTNNSNTNNSSNTTNNDSAGSTTNDNNAGNDNNTVTSTSMYQIIISISDNFAIIYKNNGSGVFKDVVYAFPVSVCSTVTAAEVSVDTKTIWKHIGYSLYGHYVTRLSDGEYLCAVACYNQNTETLNKDQYRNLGNASTVSGSIYMPAGYAKWIYENCGSDVVVKLVDDYKLPSGVTLDELPSVDEYYHDPTEDIM